MWLDSIPMLELDNQLREWFLEGRDKGTDVNAVFVGYDKNIKPCATQKIKASNALTLKKQMRMVPAGFSTGSNTAIKKTIAQIDALIETSLTSVIRTRTASSKWIARR